MSSKYLSGDRCRHYYLYLNKPNSDVIEFVLSGKTYAWFMNINKQSSYNIAKF